MNKKNKNKTDLIIILSIFQFSFFSLLCSKLFKHFLFILCDILDYNEFGGPGFLFRVDPLQGGLKRHHSIFLNPYYIEGGGEHIEPCDAKICLILPLS